MPSSFASPRNPFPLVHIGLIVVLTLLLSGWTCRAMFISCQGMGEQPQISSISPDAIPSDTNSVLLTVDGSGFTPQSQIMWNRNALQTAFANTRQLQTTISQQTFDSFGGSAGSNVQISVSSPESISDFGCSIGGNSGSLFLVID